MRFKDDNENFILKSSLPKSFGLCFKFMLFFAVEAVVLFVLSYNIKGLSENYIFVLQVLPFIFIVIAEIFAIILATILLISYLKRMKK